MRPAGSGIAYTTVAPRQKITSSPYAIESINTTYLGGVHASRFVQQDVNGNVGIGANPTGSSRLEVLSFGGNATYSECVGCTGVYAKSTNATAVYGTSGSGGGVYGKSTSFEGVRGETSGAGIGGVVGYNLAGSGFGVYGSSTGGDGVGGTSTTSSGVHGVSSSGSGVFGDSTSGFGVFGKSSSGSGVYGESSVAQSLVHGGVYGVGKVSGSIGVHGAADVGNAVGVFGTSTSASGYGVYARNFANHGLYVDGNAGQNLAYGGLVKAMVYVLANSTIPRCYNAALSGAAATAPPCGFTATRICNDPYCKTVLDFGFSVAGRFWSTSIEGTQGATGRNRGINISFNSMFPNYLDATMFLTSEPDTSNYATPFMLLVY
ncbi:MAG: hypothetical protein ABI624_07435 [Casimicrobiaceae bacterium]